jgi:hypothetical protein
MDWGTGIKNQNNKFWFGLNNRNAGNIMKAIDILTDENGKLLKTTEVDYSWDAGEDERFLLEKIHLQLVDDWGENAVLTAGMVLASFATLADEESEIKARIDEASAPF